MTPTRKPARKAPIKEPEKRDKAPVREPGDPGPARGTKPARRRGG
jgi:hypothetical protein